MPRTPAEANVAALPPTNAAEAIEPVSPFAPTEIPPGATRSGFDPSATPGPVPRCVRPSLVPTVRAVRLSPGMPTPVVPVGKVRKAGVLLAASGPTRSITIRGDTSIRCRNAAIW